MRAPAGCCLIATMATIEVPNDPGYGLRTGVTAEQLTRAKREHEEAREKNARVELIILSSGAVLVCAGISWLFHRRSQLAATADNAMVEVAAHGLKAKRETDRAIQSFADRVRERADEKLK